MGFQADTSDEVRGNTDLRIRRGWDGRIDVQGAADATFTVFLGPREKVPVPRREGMSRQEGGWRLRDAENVPVARIGVVEER